MAENIYNHLQPWLKSHFMNVLIAQAESTRVQIDRLIDMNYLTSRSISFLSSKLAKDNKHAISLNEISAFTRGTMTKQETDLKLEIMVTVSKPLETADIESCLTNYLKTFKDATFVNKNIIDAWFEVRQKLVDAKFVIRFTFYYDDISGLIDLSYQNPNIFKYVCPIAMLNHRETCRQFKWYRDNIIATAGHNSTVQLIRKIKELLHRFNIIEYFEMSHIEAIINSIRLEIRQIIPRIPNKIFVVIGFLRFIEILAKAVNNSENIPMVDYDGTFFVLIQMQNVQHVLWKINALDKIKLTIEGFELITGYTNNIFDYESELHRLAFPEFVQRSSYNEWLPHTSLNGL